MKGNQEYQGYRGVGIRLSEPMAPEMLAAVQSSRSTPFLYRGLHMFDKTQLVMLAETGIIRREDAAACLSALLQMEEGDLEDIREEMQGGIHSGEVYLIRKLGFEVGGRIHAGRSSADLTWVSTRIRMREDLLTVMDALNVHREALLNLARQHTRTVMPGYTHGQHAMATTLALYLHAWAGAAERDFTRLDTAYASTNTSPAGTAAGDASRFRLDRERTAELMGFDSVSTNTRDEFSCDHLAEMASALTILSGNLGPLADTLLLWSGQEHRLVQFADQYCHTSSILAQKRNPTALEFVRRVRNEVLGRIITSYTIYELVSAVESTSRGLKIMVGVISTLKVNKERMLDLVSSFWAQIPDLGAVLVMEKDLSWRIAHQIVAILVRLLEEEGRGPADVTPETLDRAAMEYMGKPVNLSADAIAKAMDPIDGVNNRWVIGGARPQEMEKQIGCSLDRLAEDRKKLEDRRRKLEEAERKLHQAVKTIIG